MNFVGPKIMIQRGSGGTLFESSDWSLPEGNTLLHLPTHLMFEVDVETTMLTEDGKIEVPFGFFARPIHICDGHDLPHPAEIEFVARGAIVVYLRHIGLWNPEVVEVPG